MFWFLNSLAGLLIVILKFRSRWLWLPTVTLGIYLFWVFLAWNRVPSFNDKITISGTPQATTDSIGIGVCIKHPYFSLNNFHKEFTSFWTERGVSEVGVSISINTDSIHIGNATGNKCVMHRQIDHANQLFKGKAIDSIGAIYNIGVHKELFGEIDNLISHSRYQGRSTKNGFSATKRMYIYSNNVCTDTLHIVAGLKSQNASVMNVGYNTQIRHSLLRLLRMEDISQYSYSLTLNNDNANIKCITINFGGPVNITGISPVPDIIEPSQIIYNSPTKISEIRKALGVKMFCQCIETMNVQNIRLFLLTTLSTLCIGYTLREIGIFAIFCFRCLTRKRKSGKSYLANLFNRIMHTRHKK